MDFSESDINVFQKATNLLPPDYVPPENCFANNVVQPVPGPAFPVTIRNRTVKFDPQSMYYDMTGDKIMMIFNHSHYEVNSFYGKTPPKDRIGTEHDVEALQNLFGRLGFTVHPPYQNKRRDEIMKILTEVCSQDHGGTSCVAVVIMTHGNKGQLLCAYDRPYFLSDILEIFQNGHDTLVNKPKLFFIQATETDTSLHQILLDNGSSSVHNTNSDYNTDLTAPGPSKKQESNDEACRGPLVDAGKLTQHDYYEKKLLHVSTHVDILIARSTVENYRAWKCEWGSWYIQELCNVIRVHHKDLDILQLLTLVTRAVAYKYKTYTLEPELHDKKATPETKYTLTKLLKF